MASKITLKNLEQEEFTIQHPDGIGAGTIKSTDIIYKIDSVDDFTGVPSTFDTVIVKDKDRGGVFNKIASTTANGGTVFDGIECSWERQYNGAINVKWFGDEALEATISSACALQVPLKFNIPSIIRVPTDFINIQTALDNIKGNQDVKLTLNLESGFTMSEQIIINGYDYGNVTIISEDATVSVDESSITVETIEYEDLVPIFTGINHAVLPTIGCLFEYATNTTAKDAFALSHSSKVRFLPSSYTNATPVSGCRKARRGLTLLNNSEAECNPDGLTQSDTGLSVGVDFSGCRNRALNIQHGSKASLAKSNFNDSEGDNAVYVIWNSFADIYQSTATGHLGSNAAIHSRDGSIVCARETDVSDASNRGYHALHSAMLDARYGIAQNCGTYGVLSSSCSFIDCKASDVSGSAIGVHASDSSKIEATEVTATNCTQYGLYVRSTSEISAVSSTVSNSVIGILAEDGSTINADTSNVSGCSVGYVANSISSINLNDSTVNNNTIGAKAEYSSQLNMDGVTMTNCGTYGLYISEASNAQARNATIDGADTNIYCIRGSNVNVRGASITNATNYGIYCIEGSNVNAQSANAIGAGTVGFYIARGSTINAGSASGTLNVTPNTLTSDGVIYQ